MRITQLSAFIAAALVLAACEPTPPTSAPLAPLASEICGGSDRTCEFDGTWTLIVEEDRQEERLEGHLIDATAALLWLLRRRTLIAVGKHRQELFLEEGEQGLEVAVLEKTQGDFARLVALRRVGQEDLEQAVEEELADDEVGDP